MNDMEASSFARRPRLSAERDKEDILLAEGWRLQRERQELQRKLDEVRGMLKPVECEAAVRDLLLRCEGAKAAGNECYKRGDMRGALAHYHQALQLVPNKDMLHCSCAMAHVKLGQHWDALRCATVAVALRRTGDYWKALLHRAYAKQALNHLQGAMEDLRQALVSMTDEQQKAKAQARLQRLRAKVREQEARKQRARGRATRHRSAVTEQMDDGPDDLEAVRVKNRVQEVEDEAAADATRLDRLATEAVARRLQQLQHDAEQQQRAAVAALGERASALREPTRLLDERVGQRQLRAALQARLQMSMTTLDSSWPPFLPPAAAVPAAASAHPAAASTHPRLHSAAMHAATSTAAASATMLA